MDPNPGVPLLDMDDMAIPDQTLSPPEIALVLETHSLMRRYADKRLQRPLQVLAISAETLQEYIAMIAGALRKVKDPAALLDAQSVLMCIDAVYFGASVGDWVRQTDPGWEPDQIKTLVNYSNPSEHALFWRFLSEAIVSNRRDAAINALERGTDAVYDDLDEHTRRCLDGLGELLATYPSLRSVPAAGPCAESFVTTAESLAAWGQWRKQALNLRSQCDRIADLAWRVPLVRLASLLHGNKEAILAAAPNWYTAVGALFAYTDPRREELFAYYTLATSAHSVDWTLEWEAACAAAFQRQLQRAFASLSRLDPGQALVVAELCFRSDLVKDYPLASNAPSLRETLALRHILQCLAYPELVDAGLELLQDMSNDSAKSLAAHVLPQLAAQTPSMAPAALRAAQALELTGTVRTLRQDSAKRAAAKGDVATAIVDYVEADDLLTARTTGWALFESSLVAGKITTENTLTLSILENPHVAPSLPRAAAQCLSPPAVLAAIFAAINAKDVPLLAKNLAALLSLEALPAAYGPLLVAITTQIPLETLGTRGVAGMIAALDRWDSSPEKQRGLDLLAAAKSSQWAAGVQSYAPEDIVWMLRRRLAKEVFA